MGLLRQFQACLLYFFFTKIFRAPKKHQNAKQTTFKFLHAKNCCPCCLVLAYLCFVDSFMVVTCFCAREILS